jgi:hypothetical protein
MSRDLPAELESAVEAPVIAPFLAVRIEFDDPVLVWTGIGVLTFDDSDGEERAWDGTGGLGSIDSVGEATDGSATGVKVGLNNIPSQFAADLADQAQKGALFEVYVGSLNQSLQAVEAVKLIFKGRVDEYRILDAGERLSVEVTGESRAIDQRRPAIKKFSHEYQQRQYPGDLFFQYLPQMVEVSILWAKAEPKGAAVGGGGGGGGGGTFNNNQPF